MTPVRRVKARAGRSVPIPTSHGFEQMAIALELHRANAALHAQAVAQEDKRRCPLPTRAHRGPRGRSYAVAAHVSSSQSSPPRQRRGGDERGGTGVEEQGSRGSRVGSPQPYRERREAGGRAGGYQADPPGCIAVEDRA